MNEKKVTFCVLVITICIWPAPAEVQANDCCEFALPAGCMSVPAPAPPPANWCTNNGGVFMAGHFCNAATGDCAPKPGGTNAYFCCGDDATCNETQLCSDVYTDLGVGACCKTDGTCAATTEALCTSGGGLYGGDGSLCPGGPLGATGACCGAGPCAEVAQVCCQSLPSRKFRGGTCAAANCDGIPTVSEWGLVVMLLLVGAAGTVVIMRRNALIG